jgi:hypothetical protein
VLYHFTTGRIVFRGLSTVEESGGKGRCPWEHLTLPKHGRADGLSGSEWLDGPAKTAHANKRLHGRRGGNRCRLWATKRAHAAYDGHIDTGLDDG